MKTCTYGDFSIPKLGFGTWLLSPETAYRMVGEALRIGYRHIDTAQIYKNEEAVGTAIKESGIPREEIFLTTKVWINKMTPGELQRSVKKSLERLQTESVDLLLLHWPNPDVDLKGSLEAMADCQNKAYTRHIGISNYTVDWLKKTNEALSSMENRPNLVTNQVEYHPYLSQKPVLEAMGNDIPVLTAYSPLAQGKVVGDRTLMAIGQRYQATAPQVALAWLLAQPRVSCIPRTSSKAHCQSNFEARNLTLSDADLAEISTLAHPGGRVCTPPGISPKWDD